MMEKQGNPSKSGRKYYKFGIKIGHQSGIDFTIDSFCVTVNEVKKEKKTGFLSFSYSKTKIFQSYTFGMYAYEDKNGLYEIVTGRPLKPLVDAKGFGGDTIYYNKLTPVTNDSGMHDMAIDLMLLKDNQEFKSKYIEDLTNLVKRSKEDFVPSAPENSKGRLKGRI